MGNSLLAVRGINHKYIVVGGRKEMFIIKRERRLWQDKLILQLRHQIVPTMQSFTVFGL